MIISTPFRKSRISMHFLIACLFAVWLLPVNAHSVQHHIETGPAVVLTLTYAKGTPFAHEKYTLQAAGKAQPTRSGHTDADGRIVFIPGNITHWHLKAHATDGHGLRLDFTVPQVATPTPTPPNPLPDDGPNNASRILFGLALILGGFGAYQLVLRRRPPPA
jgi:nickel transport protein